MSTDTLGGRFQSKYHSQVKGCLVRRLLEGGHVSGRNVQMHCVHNGLATGHPGSRQRSKRNPMSDFWIYLNLLTHLDSFKSSLVTPCLRLHLLCQQFSVEKKCVTIRAVGFILISFLGRHKFPLLSLWLSACVSLSEKCCSRCHLFNRPLQSIPKHWLTYQHAKKKTHIQNGRPFLIAAARVAWCKGGSTYPICADVPWVLPASDWTLYPCRQALHISLSLQSPA